MIKVLTPHAVSLAHELQTGPRGSPFLIGVLINCAICSKMAIYNKPSDSVSKSESLVHLIHSDTVLVARLYSVSFVFIYLRIIILPVYLCC